MKKIFTLIAFCAASFAIAQSFSAYKMNNTQTATLATLSNGYILNESTTASPTISPVVTATKVKIVNDAATTVTLGVERTIVYNNPPLKVDGGTSTPDTYFCFGFSCFASNVSVAPSSDYTILGPNGSSTQPDNSVDAGQPFLIDLVESSVMGKYFVKYKIYNVNDANDTVAFTVKYNEFLSVSENNNIIANVSDIFPNPSSSNAHLSLTLTQESPVKVQVYNSLGALVYTGNELKYPQGKNKISIDCSNLNSGIYLVSLNAGESKITKRLIINK